MSGSQLDVNSLSHRDAHDTSKCKYQCFMVSETVSGTGVKCGLRSWTSEICFLFLLGQTGTEYVGEWKNNVVCSAQIRRSIEFWVLLRIYTLPCWSLIMLGMVEYVYRMIAHHVLGLNFSAVRTRFQPFDWVIHFQNLFGSRGHYFVIVLSAHLFISSTFMIAVCICTKNTFAEHSQYVSISLFLHCMYTCPAHMTSK